MLLIGAKKFIDIYDLFSKLKGMCCRTMQEINEFGNLVSLGAYYHLNGKTAPIKVEFFLVV